MQAKKTGQELIEFKLLQARMIQQYFNTSNIIEQAEWEERYHNLIQKEIEFNNVELTDAQKETIKKLDLIKGLYEQYYSSTNVLEKAEWEEKLRNTLELLMEDDK